MMVELGSSQHASAGGKNDKPRIVIQKQKFNPNN